MLRRIIPGLAAVALAVACASDPAAPVSSEELVLAQDAQLIAQEVGATTGATHDRWIARLLDTLRTTDDPEALAFLQQAREYRELARQAREAGDYEAAREYLRLSFRALLSAVIEIYPNAPARTGAAVDEAVARIELHLGDRDAPHIRRVLAHVRELRNAADAALAAGDPVTALAINLRAMHILHRLVYHLRDGMDHDREADRDMEGSAEGMGF
jgi:hypothetical protein